ncbi:MAG: SCO family protein [Candidatus Zixiibacteriota bacterium]
MNKRFISNLRWIIPAVVFLFLLGTAVIWWAESSRGKLPILGEIPEFSMTERNGQPFGRTDLNGKISVVCFGFTHCRSICPTTCMYMSQLYNYFSGSDKIQFLFISVDPERDSLRVLQAFAEKWGVMDNRWNFLRAPIEDVVRLSEEGFMLPAEGLPGGHTYRFTLLDRQGRIRGYYDGTDEKSMMILKNHISMLARER